MKLNTRKNSLCLLNTIVEHLENATLKCSKISTFQNRKIKMQRKYNVLNERLQNYATTTFKQSCP